MKKAIVILLTGIMMTAVSACGNLTGAASSAASTPNEGTAQDEQDEEKEETFTSGVVEDDKEEEMEITEEPIPYEEFAAAEIDSEIIIMGAVQAKQTLHAEGDSTVCDIFLQDEDGGAYYLYELPCTEKEYELLEIGKMIKVKGYKANWHEEVEIIDMIWQFEDGEYIAEPKDVTALLGSEELINRQNKFVSFKGMTVEAAGKDAEGNDIAYKYNWDGSGSDGDDLYFNVSRNGQTYLFTVESALCSFDTPVYQAVKELQIGDVVDLEGFLYWFDELNPHITSVDAVL